MYEYLQRATPVGRLGTPEEVASLYVYLASPGADFITGAAIAIDGGQLAI
jgi:NAD(P)-dependent dehydrogenase (short-subunit alcohol dehydrogenase family)